MVLSYALGVLVLIFVLLRQMSIRPVRRQLSIRTPVILGVIGLFEMFGYAGDHHPTGLDVLWVVGTLVIGAAALGAVRALTVRVWSTGQIVVRQGTALTMALWVVSLAAHLYVDGGGGHKGASGLEQASFLLYLALTLGVQNYFVYRRGLSLWQELGPDAGRGFQFTFGTAPAGMQTFFANFRNGASGSGPPAPGPAPYGESEIIDAEVVDDDDPPELHR
jgi:hypothetical protein